MDGITDSAMRDYQGTCGAFSYAVSEFIRVSSDPLPAKVFLREVPELASRSLTPSGLPVQVQILGGDPERMAQSAVAAVRAGAMAIDLNFGCPAPTVNRNDGGASLLRSPCRIRDVVSAVRSAVPESVPVSAKLRLGWDSIDAIHENAAMAAEGGASWLTIHARTRTQGYAPPVYWEPIRQVREALGIPVIANGDIWTIDDFRRCQDVTGAQHFMVGRGALADPRLPGQIAYELGLRSSEPVREVDWIASIEGFLACSTGASEARTLSRLKQWLNLASRYGEFVGFDEVKRIDGLGQFLNALRGVLAPKSLALV